MALWFFFDGVNVTGRLVFSAAGGQFQASEAPIEPVEGATSLPFTVEPSDLDEVILTPLDPDNFTASCGVPFQIRGPHVAVRVDNFEGPAEVAWPIWIGSMMRGPLPPGRFQPLQYIGEAEED